MSASNLPYKFLGDTGVKVTSLCLGTATFGKQEVIFFLVRHKVCNDMFGPPKSGPRIKIFEPSEIFYLSSLDAG